MSPFTKLYRKVQNCNVIQCYDQSHKSIRSTGSKHSNLHDITFVQGILWFIVHVWVRKQNQEQTQIIGPSDLGLIYLILKIIMWYALKGPSERINNVNDFHFESV